VGSWPAFGTAASLAREAAALVTHESLLAPNEVTEAAALRWNRFADERMHAYQDQALRGCQRH